MALEREKAIAYGKKIALDRGDTESVDHMGDRHEFNIVNKRTALPMFFLRFTLHSLWYQDFNAMITNAGSAFEAGLGVMALGLSGFSSAN